LVVIGQRWVGSRGGQARISDESDPVRIEIETAIGRSIPIIPLLIANTRMPNTSQLPKTLKAFAFLNALRIDPGQDFDHHTDRPEWANWLHASSKCGLVVVQTFCRS
jgi:hypothetical protein